MIIPVGSLINFAAIIVGSTLGLLLGNRLTADIRKIVFQGLGICIVVIGLQMALATGNILVVLFSVLLGGIIGQILDIETFLGTVGDNLKRLTGSGSGTFTQGFVNATILFCIGSMAILGPLEEGLRGDMSILLTKSVLDGFSAMAFAAAMGIGVMFAAAPVLVLQGLITIFAVYLSGVLSPQMITELKATGGILIIGIGLNMLELTKIKLSNLLPALPFAILLVFVLSQF